MSVLDWSAFSGFIVSTKQTKPFQSDIIREFYWNISCFQLLNIYTFCKFTRNKTKTRPIFKKWICQIYSNFDISLRQFTTRDWNFKNCMQFSLQLRSNQAWRLCYVSLSNWIYISQNKFLEINKVCHCLRYNYTIDFSSYRIIIIRGLYIILLNVR